MTISIGFFFLAFAPAVMVVIIAQGVFFSVGDLRKLNLYLTIESNLLYFYCGFYLEGG